MKKCALLFLCIAMLLILAVPGFAETPPTAPTIVTQPVDLSLTYGYTDGNVLSVSASAADGYTLSYQWYSNTNASNEGGTAIEGATEESYAVPVGKHAGTTEYYYCVVTATRTDNRQTAETVSDAATVSIGKATPTVTAPTVDAVTYGTFLSSITLTNPKGNIPGEWSWMEDDASNINEEYIPDAGEYTFQAKFTPDDTVNYNETTKEVSVTVTKADLKITIDGHSEIYGEPPRDVVVWCHPDYDGKVTILVGDNVITSPGTTAEHGVVTVGHEPMNVGKYDIKVIAAETSNYLSNEQTSPGALEILPVPNPAFIQPAVNIQRGTNYDLSQLVSVEYGTVRFALDETPNGYSLSGNTLTLADNAAESCKIKVTVDGGNYESAEGEITVTAESLSTQENFKFADLSLEKTYGDGDFTVAATGAVTGSIVTYSSSDPTVATVEEATGKVHILKVGKATITATAGATGTYAEATACCWLTVNPKPVTISGVTAEDQEYGGSPNISLDTSKADIDGKLEGDNLTVSATGAITYLNVGESTVEISYTLGGAAAGNYTLAEEGQQETTTVNILPKPVIVSGITAVDKTYDGTTQATLDYTNALIGEEKCSVWLTVTATGAFADENVGVGKIVTISGLKLVGFDAENYRLAESGQQETASASITAKEVGLNWTNTRLTYTGEAQKPTATVTGLVEGEPCTVTVTGEQTNAGAGYTATAVGLSSNYKLLGNETVTFKISKAIPVIAPTASAIIYGQTLADSTLSDGVGSVPGSFKWKDQTVAPVVSDSQTKEYDVVFTPTDTANYYEVERKLKLTVNQKEVGLTWSDTPLTYNGSAQAPTAEATELVNNDEIGVTVSGAQTNAGTYTATASSLTGDKAGNYKLPEANTTSFSIGQKEVSLTWGSTALTYNGLPQAPTANATGLVDGDVIGVSVSGALTNVGTGYTATASGLTGDKAGNYKLPGEVTTSFSIAQKEVGLTWGSTALTYNGLPQAPTAEATGLANGDEIGVTVTGTMTYPGAGYTATARDLTGDKAGNYKLPGENTTTTFAIGKAPLTVTANPKTITYGDEPANDGVTYSGFVNSETESDLNGTLAYDYNYTQYGDAGSYTITPKGLTSDNYEITFVAGTLTVNPKPVTVNGITAKDKDYDGTADATLDCTNAVIDGKLDRDELTVTATGAFVDKNVGVGKTVNISGYTLVGDGKDNYQVATTEGTQSTATATISAVPLTVTANPKTITYGDAPVNDGVAYSGFVNSETESVLGGKLDYDYSYTQYGDVGNSYTITPKGLTSDNYNITFHANTLTVEQKEVGLTWNASLTYNGLLQAPTAEATGLVNNDVIGVTVSGAQTNAGTGYTATASGLTGDKVGNYKLPAANTLTFAIGKAPLTVTAKPKAITYGDASANDGVTYSGFVNRETENDLNGTLAYDYNYTQYGDAGSYTITPKGLTSDNYEITFKPGILTVGQKEVGLSWSTAPLTFSGLPQAPTAVATETVNNDTIGVAVSGAQTNAGTGYTATASGLTGDKAGSYKLPATGLTQEFAIGKAAAQTIPDVTDTLVYTLTSVSKSVADKMPENAGTRTYTVGTATRTGSVTVTGFGVDNSGTVTATLTGGAVNDTVTLPVTISSTNYADSAVNVVITLTDRHTQTITVSDVTVTYGDTDKKISATTDGNGAISCAVKDGSGDYIDVDAASGALMIKKVPADGKAYVIVTAAETLTYKQATKEVTVTIHKANAVPATVTANDRTYDGSEKPLVTVTGTVTGGTMQYALGSATEATGSYSTSIPSKTDAGTWYVWYKVEGDDNHTGTEPDKVKVTISPTDKTALNAAIAEAETCYNGIRDDYADIAATLKTAIETAKAVAGNDNTTESAVADAITALNGAVDAAKGGVKKVDDEAAAKKVVDAISALPENAGVGDKPAVEAARAAYEALTDDQKKLVGEDVLAKLTAAEQQVRDAEEEARKVNISECKITVKSQTYTGKKLKPDVTVKYGKTTLKKGTDYTVTYRDNVNPGTATATVKGKGDYTGSAEVTFAIRVPLSKCKLTVKDQTYTGKALEPAVTVKYGKTTLKKGTDYTVTYANNVKPGTATATVKGKGNYTGSAEVTFAIRVPLSKCKLAVKDQTYTGKALEPAVTVKYGKATLKKGTDYTVTYKNNVKPGTATATVKGKGNYTGSAEVTFAIRVPLSKCKLTVKDQAYTGKALKPAVTVKYGKTTLKKGTDYTVTYKNNVKPGTATATVKGKGNYTGSAKVTFAIRVPLSKCKLAVKDQTYTGKALEPAVTVKYGKATLKAGTDYTVTYKNNVKPGTATATVKGKGKYTGSAKISFKITLNGTAFTKLTGGNRQITLYWNNQKNVTGYEIQYSLKKSFPDKKTVKIEKAATLTATIEELKANKTYYVRIRTYATIQKKNYYSAWSRAMTVKTEAGKAKNASGIQPEEMEELTTGSLVDDGLLPVTGDIDGEAIVMDAA